MVNKNVFFYFILKILQKFIIKYKFPSKFIIINKNDKLKNI